MRDRESREVSLPFENYFMNEYCELMAPAHVFKMSRDRK